MRIEASSTWKNNTNWSFTAAHRVIVLSWTGVCPSLPGKWHGHGPPRSYSNPCHGAGIWAIEPWLDLAMLKDSPGTCGLVGWENVKRI